MVTVQHENLRNSIIIYIHLFGKCLFRGEFTHNGCTQLLALCYFKWTVVAMDCVDIKGHDTCIYTRLFKCWNVHVTHRNRSIICINGRRGPMSFVCILMNYIDEIWRTLFNDVHCDKSSYTFYTFVLYHITCWHCVTFWDRFLFEDSKCTRIFL